MVIGRVITIRPAVRPWHDITDPDVAKALAHPSPNAAWGELPTIVKDAAIKAALDQIGAYVAAGAAEGGFNAADAHISRTPVTVDSKGWHALARELDNLLERITKIAAASEQRLARSDHADEQEATAVLMLFGSPTAGPAQVDPDHRRSPARASRRPRW